MTSTLREGFTTGSAVAAAAKVATELMLASAHDYMPLPTAQSVSIPLPPFAAPHQPPQEAKRYTVPVLSYKIHCIVTHPDVFFAETTIIKDGGDDPDATNNAHITVWAASVPFTPQVQAALALAQGGYTQPPGSTRILPRTITLTEKAHTITIYAGAGVGTVTLAGLPVPVGDPAINPVPREQIAKAVVESLRKYSSNQPVYLWVCVNNGEQIAQHTLNPRLGILGGISILGTQGTVRPYSHEAWEATICQGLAVAKAAQQTTILFSTGRRSERALFTLYPALPPMCGIQAADFAAFSLQEAVKRQFTHLVWGCYLGKLLKLAQNLPYTHAKSAPADLTLLATIAQQHGTPQTICTQIIAMPTAVGAFALLQNAAPECFLPTLTALATTAYGNMMQWCTAEAAAKQIPCPQLTLHVFSMENELLLSM